jgi:hypothetical protein
LPRIKVREILVCQEERKDKLMNTLSADPSATVLSSAWMPLDGLIQQWGTFGAEQTVSAPALHAVGKAFCALSCETTARSYYTAAWHTSHNADLTELEHTLEELLSARQSWTDTMLSLELLLLDAREEQSSGDSLRSLLVEVMEQRSRVALLIHQTQQEQLAVYRRDERKQPRGDETGLACSGQESSTVIHVPLLEGIPEACLLYGHEWEQSELPGAKQCHICGILGFCPSCVLLRPPDAQPFRCSRHTPLTESQVSE